MINRCKGIVLLLCSASLLACATPQAEHDNESPKSEQNKQLLSEQMQQMEPQFLYLAAQNAIKDGNRELAVEFLAALVAKDPDSIEPQIQLTGLLMQLQRSKEAEKQIEQLLKKPLQPEDHEKMLLIQARLMVASDRQERALELLDALFKTNPVNLHGRDLQARILAGQKRYGEGLNAINEAILIEELPEFRLLQAQLHLKMNELSEAKISLRRLQKLAPDNETAVLMLSSISLQEKKKAEAETILRDFLTAHPNALQVAHALGKILIQEKRVAEAILIYRDLANRMGESPAVMKTLGMLYFRYHDFENAADVFRKMHKAKPDDESRYYLAASLEALKQPTEARKLYEAIDPDGELGVDAQVRLAGIDFSDGHEYQAMQRLNQALRKDPRHIDASVMRSAIRLSRKEYEILLEESEILVTEGSVHPQLLFNRAAAFEFLKRYEPLDATLTRLLAASPNHSEALNFLGYSYATRGIHLNKAEQMIKRALSIKPNDGYYLDSLAWVYYQRSEYSKALKTQRQAIKQIDDDPVMYEHLGDILWKTGDHVAARHAWQRSIDLKAESPEALRQKIEHGLKQEQ